MRGTIVGLAWRAVAALFAVILSVGLMSSALSQIPENVQALIEEAEKAGMTVIVISPETHEPVAAAEPAQHDSIQSAVARLTTEIRQIASSWSMLRAEARDALASHGDGSRSWVVPTLLFGLVPLAIGAAAAWSLGRSLRARISRALPYVPRDRADRLLHLLGLAVLRISLLAVVLVVTLIVAAIVRDDSTAWQVTISSYMLATTIVAGVWIMVGVFLAPDAPHLRVLALTDEEARRLQLHVIAAIVVGVALMGIVRWTLLLGVPQDALKPIVIIAMLATAIGLSIVAVLHRQPIGRLIAGAPGSGVISGWRHVLARLWPVMAVAYFLIAWLVGSVRVLLDRSGSIGLVAMPIVVLLGSLALYGLLLLVIDLAAARHAQRKLHRAALAAAALAGSEPQPSLALSEPQIPGSGEPSVLKHLLERAAAVISFTVGLYFLATLWGVDEVAGETMAAAIVQIIVVLLLAHIGYQAVRLWIDRKIAEELRLPGHGASAPSRLGTLLPIFRNFMFVSIGVIASLIVLSRMGVDIGPLLAGAGVVGIAIGFGAQTLVKDIISGAFFLIDDAFRVGEYIDLGGSKGTVEKISIRSMQLRHQNGPLNTVPFGSIGEVSNFSRDWAIMKLPLRVPYDTDVEKVRKLIKKLGDELLQDPEIGKYFLDSVKSQGITAMEDSAMVIQVKFMTHPAYQSEVRKAVYMHIQNLFHREGIKFAQKEVRVRIAEGDTDHETARRQAAAHAAAQAVIDDEETLAAMQPSKA